MHPVVLLVEDSPADVRLTQEAFAELADPVDLRVAHDGLEALDTLRRGGPHGEALRPQLILLDLNMPRMDGREVLAQLKQDPELCRIPVVVLTTSEDEADVMEVYQLHANCYVAKPIDLDRFFHVISTIHAFWLCTARLPTS